MLWKKLMHKIVKIEKKYNETSISCTHGSLKQSNCIFSLFVVKICTMNDASQYSHICAMCSFVVVCIIYLIYVSRYVRIFELFRTTSHRKNFQPSPPFQSEKRCYSGQWVMSEYRSTGTLTGFSERLIIL